MKREDISRALGDIDLAFIEEAADGARSSRRWLRTVLPLAACLVLVLTAAWFGGWGDREKASGGDEVPSPTEAAEGIVAATRPPLELVGGAMTERAPASEASGVITALDREGRRLTLRLSDGTELTAGVPEHLDLTGLETGSAVTLSWLGTAETGMLEAEQLLELHLTKGETP